jgi:hypothetical protein
VPRTRLARWGLLAAGTLAAAGLGALVVPPVAAFALSAAEHARERAREKAAWAPLVAEAEREALDFPAVVVAPHQAAERLVYWELSIHGSTAAVVDGHPAWLVAWTNPERVDHDRLYGTLRLLARVKGVDRETVRLEYLGRP